MCKIWDQNWNWFFFTFNVDSSFIAVLKAKLTNFSSWNYFVSFFYFLKAKWNKQILSGKEKHFCKIPLLFFNIRLHFLKRFIWLTEIVTFIFLTPQSPSPDIFMISAPYSAKVISFLLMKMQFLSHCYQVHTIP